MMKNKQENFKLQHVWGAADLSLTVTTSASVQCVKADLSSFLQLQNSPGNTTAPHNKADNIIFLLLLLLLRPLHQ